jgi:hypothetical protein
MKDELPRKVKNIECGIINLQNSNESGIHWVAYYKNNDKSIILILMEMVLHPKSLLNM